MSESTNKLATVEKGPDSSLDLAIERTQLALERTHLAWIRTMFTLMTAGLAIDKGMAFIHQQRITSGTAWINNAHFIGLTLTIAGTVLLLIEAILFVRRKLQLAKMKKEKSDILSTAGIPTAAMLSAIVIFLGIVLTILMIMTR